MKGLRVISLMLLLWPAACTRPNPDYAPSDGDVVACTPGERTCSGANLMVCVATPEPHLELERLCPAPARCQEGVCVPAGDTCEDFCDVPLICTVFAVPGVGQLDTYCAEATGTKPGGVPCANSDDCQSGLCVSGGKVPVCFRGCSKNHECGFGGLRCLDLKLTVNGVSGAIAACVP
jgi:hypothetical protein